MPVCLLTGQKRQALEAFVAAFGVNTHNSHADAASGSDPVLQVRHALWL